MGRSEGELGLGKSGGLKNDVIEVWIEVVERVVLLVVVLFVVVLFVVVLLVVVVDAVVVVVAVVAAVIAASRVVGRAGPQHRPGRGGGASPSPTGGRRSAE